MSDEEIRCINAQRRSFVQAFAARAIAYEQRRHGKPEPLIWWTWRGFLGLDEFPHTAANVVYASMEYSLVGRQSAGEEAVAVAEFVRRYRRDRLLDMDSMSIGEVRELLETYAAWFDRHFFFSLLTGASRRLRAPHERLPRSGQLWKMSPWRGAGQSYPEVQGRLVDLIITRDPPMLPGRYLPIMMVHGYYQQNMDQIKMYAHDPHMQPHDLDELVATLMHELTHAYVILFSNNTSWSNSYAEVDYGGGHGPEFCRQQVFMLELMDRWMPESTFWRKLEWARTDLNEAQRKTRGAIMSASFESLRLISCVIGYLAVLLLLMSLIIWLIDLFFDFRTLSLGYKFAAFSVIPAVSHVWISMASAFFLEWLPEFLGSAKADEVAQFLKPLGLPGVIFAVSLFVVLLLDTVRELVSIGFIVIRMAVKCVVMCMYKVATEVRWMTGKVVGR